jgi:hypothetical protein
MSHHVVLIHGLGRTPLSLMNLERRLRQQGWSTEQFGYAAFLESYDQIVERLRPRLQALSLRGAYSIVAHSLGGLLTRSALAPATFANPAQVVMLGTPNRPPRLAAFAWKLPLFQWFAGQCGGNLANPAFFQQLPGLQSPYTIIAGTAGPRGFLSPFGEEVNDGIVALSETALSDQDPLVQLPVNHTFMMHDPAVQETVVQSLLQRN